MNLGIDGRIALVTGGSRGIGKEVSRGLAREGAVVAISARDEEPLSRLTEELRGAGLRASAFPADVSDERQVRQLVARVRSELGDPQILVVNAGGPTPGVPTSLGEADWERGFELTLMSSVRLVREALPAMLSAGWGRIINITSLAVKQPVLNLALSNAFRSAVTAFARTLANEVAAKGVTVNNVGPGYTATERLNELFADDEARQRLIESIPAKRLGAPEEIASAVIYLASEQAAYLTGQTIVPDGGATQGLL